MALITVYDAKGVSVAVDACDAREYVASGRWFSSDPTVAEGKASAAPAPTGDLPPAPTGDLPPAAEMNGTQLRATLAAMGIEVKSNATKAGMKTLLDEATKKE